MMSVLRETPLAHDVFRQESHPLTPFFRPRTVAVIGATEAPGSVGRTLLRNLLGTPFGGTVYPVNPKRDSVLGVQAYRSVADIPAAVDLAVVATPAVAVPAIIGQCADRGIPAAIVISAGFRETGLAGAALERQVLAEARRGRMRLVGPNCLGVMRPTSGLNATFAAGMARPGNVALLSQSGALLTALLDWSLRERVGFSAVVSLGSMLDVGWGDLIDYFGDDPHTRAIVVYMESIGDARAFLSAAREVALTKPIVVIKAGRSQAASRAAASHTGALTGSDEVLDAAFQRVGVLRVNEIGEVFALVDVLGKQPRPAGPRLTVVTNAGGPGVLATDALVAAGGELAELSADHRRATRRGPAFGMEPRQSHRCPGRCQSGALHHRAGARCGRPRQRRAAGDPHASGHDRPHGDRPGACPVRPCRGQAGAGQLDGRKTGGGRDRRPECRRDPLVRFS